MLSQAVAGAQSSNFHIPLDQLMTGQNAKQQQLIPPQQSTSSRLLNHPLPPPHYTTSAVNPSGYTPLPYPTNTSEHTDINENDEYKKTFSASSQSNMERNHSVHLHGDANNQRANSTIGGAKVGSPPPQSKPYKSSDPALAAVNYSSSHDTDKLISQQPPTFTLSSLTQDTERLNTMYQLPSISRTFVTDEDDDYDA